MSTDVIIAHAEALTAAEKAILAQRRIIAQLYRIIRCTYQRGQLAKVVLYPCHCGRYTIDEWYAPSPGKFHKEESVVEVADTTEARNLYRGVFGKLRESIYNPADDSYSSRDEDDNFIVTGSHCTCSEHRSVTSHQRPR
jgi:hypothetical protein